MPHIVDRKADVIDRIVNRTREAVQPSLDGPPALDLPTQSRPIDRLQLAQRQLTATRRVGETEDDYISRLEESGFDPMEIGDALANVMPRTAGPRTTAGGASRGVSVGGGPSGGVSFGGAGGQPLTRPERISREEDISERMERRRMEREERLASRERILARRDRILRRQFGTQGPSRESLLQRAGMVPEPTAPQTTSTGFQGHELQQNIAASKAVVEAYKASGVVSPQLQPFVDAIAESGMPPNQVRLALDGMRLRKEKPDSPYTIAEMRAVMGTEPPESLPRGPGSPRPAPDNDFTKWVEEATQRLDHARRVQQPATPAGQSRDQGEGAFGAGIGDQPEQTTRPTKTKGGVQLDSSGRPIVGIGNTATHENVLYWNAPNAGLVSFDLAYLSSVKGTHTPDEVIIKVAESTGQEVPVKVQAAIRRAMK